MSDVPPTDEGPRAEHAPSLHRRLGTGIKRKSVRGRWEQRGARIGKGGGQFALESTPASEPVPLAATSDPTAAAPKKFPVRSGVVVLHDLRIPGSGGSVDHVCVGPGGVTVVKVVGLRGKVRARGSKLSIGGRDRSDLIRDVRLEVAKVRAVLGGAGRGTVDIRAAISMATVDGLPSLRRVEVKGVRVDGQRRVAALAGREPQGRPVSVERVVEALRARLSTASR